MQSIGPRSEDDKRDHKACHDDIDLVLTLVAEQKYLRPLQRSPNAETHPGKQETSGKLKVEADRWTQHEASHKSGGEGRIGFTCNYFGLRYAIKN